NPQHQSPRTAIGIGYEGRDRYLRERNEVLHQAIFAVRWEERTLAHVVRHTDDLSARYRRRRRGRAGRRLGVEARIETDPDALADRALPRPQRPRHGLVDDDDGRSPVVRGHELAALDDPDPENVEVFRRGRLQKRQLAV